MSDLFGSDPTCGIAVDAAGDDFYTPQWILDLLPQIRLDPCWSPASLVEPIERFNMRIGEDGLALPWNVDGFVFVNPPYSDTARWLAKARSEANATGNVVCVLVPAYPGDGPWHKSVWPDARFVGFFCHRIKFLCPDGSHEQKGRGHALILYGRADKCANARASIARRDREQKLVWVQVCQ